MKILNLYAGIGGNRKLWGSHDITAVEIDPDIAKVYSDFYPGDKVIVGDAHEFLLNNYSEFDFIWSSPPCQSHSKMMKATKHDIRKYPDMKLYEEIIFLKHFCSGPWIVENVKPYYKPLIEPSDSIGRHYVWNNFTIRHFNIKNPKNFINSTTTSGAQELKNWLDIHYKGNIYYKNNHCPGQVLRNCVHPKLGKHILDCAMKYDIKEEQLELFS